MHAPVASEPPGPGSEQASPPRIPAAPASPSGAGAPGAPAARPGPVPSPWRVHVTTLVYVLHDDHLLLLCRRREPNRGLWSPPGGKLEPGESPPAGALRELAEETGLVGRDPSLEVVVSEADEARREAWLMFAVRARVDGRGPLTACDEGDPAWVPLRDVPGLQKPPADDRILAAVLEPGLVFLTVTFDDGRLVSVRPG